MGPSRIQEIEMWTQMEPARIVSTLLLLFHLSGTASAFRMSPFQGAPRATPASSRIESDLTSLLFTKPADHQELFSEAVQLLNSMKSSPSCNRLAVTNLITSCQQLDPDDKSNVDLTRADLDSIKSLYAARLAICEVTGAGARIPEECSPVASLRNSKTTRSFAHGYSTVSREDTVIDVEQLEPCLQALESKPQWWTSYSNNRQNAAVMCQAARIEMEREELLSHHRNLVDVTLGLSQTLNHSLENAAAATAQHKIFIETVDEMRQKVLQDINDTGFATRGLFQDLAADVEAMFRNSVADVQTHIASAGSETATLSRDIQASVSSIQNVKEALNEVYLDAMRRGSEMAAAEHDNLRANSELALTVQRSLEEIRQEKLGAMADEFGSLHATLKSLNDLAVSTQQSQESLDERLKYFDHAFEQLEYKATVLDMMLQWHITNHTRFQQSLEVDMRVAQALLKEITLSTANLQTTIAETYRMMNKIGTIGVTMGSIPWWLWVLACICLTALLIPRAAAAFFLFSVGILSTRTFARLKHLELSTFNSAWPYSYLELGFFLFGLTLSAGIVVTLAKKGFWAPTYIPRLISHQRDLPSRKSYLP